MLFSPLARPSNTEEEQAKVIRELRFPVIATPKLDGIRCVTTQVSPGEKGRCGAYSRSLDKIENTYIREKIEKECPPGLDGEIITYDQRTLLDTVEKAREFHSIQSDVMSRQGAPFFRYHVFDGAIGSELPYAERLHWLWTEPDIPIFVTLVQYELIKCLDDLQVYMAQQCQAGYEGICFRTPDSPYKHGRSTLREQWGVKWKLFDTAEAVIVGYEEEMQNNNAPTIGKTGYQERSSHSANMTPKGRLGALICRNLNSMDGPEDRFKIGTGFSADQRANMWFAKETLIGRVVHYKHQTYGAKDKPRIPVFMGFRDHRDMDKNPVS